MHGHAQSGTRKLNRHWQSGKQDHFELEENLVYFEREIDVTEWPADTGDILPYWKKYDDGAQDNGSWLHLQYEKKNPVRSEAGFKQLVITQPGNYKVHWYIETHKIESFTRDNKIWDKIVEGDYNQNFGMFGVNMYPRVDYIRLYPTDINRYMTTNGIDYYTGGCDSYFAKRTDHFSDADWYDGDITVDVRPYRTSTYTYRFFLSLGANTFNLSSETEEQTPEVILHIGGQAPFEEYTFKPVYNYDTRQYEGTFQHEGYYYAPLIDFLFCNNIDSFYSKGFIITGKIWLERVGDYTEEAEGWEPKIL